MRGLFMLLDLDRDSLIKFSLRLFGSWAVAAIISVVFGKTLISLFLPLFSNVIKVVYPNLEISMQLLEGSQGWAIQSSYLSTGLFQTPSGLKMPAGQKVNAGIDVLHALVPLAIYAIAWSLLPSKSVVERALYTTFGIPLFFVVLVLSVPFLLMGHFEMFLYQVDQGQGASIEPSGLIDWMVFLEGGGLWVLPLFAVFQCVLFTKITLYQVGKVFDVA